MNYTEKAKEWVSESGITAQKLSNAIDNAIDFVDGETCLASTGESYHHEVCMEIIADNVHGLNMPEIVVPYFDMELEDNWQDDEFIWESIESMAEAVADELNQTLGELNTRNGWFYFGTIDDMGDYALFYRWETE